MDISNLDPSLAALLEDVPTDTPKSPIDVFPDLTNDFMLSKAPEASGSDVKDASTVDLTVTQFPEVTSFYKKKGHSYFDSSEFYKRVLKNCGDESHKLHAVLTKYLTTHDQKDKSVYRQQILTNYWRFISNLILKLPTDEAAVEKKYALRYGLVLPTLLAAEQKDTFAKIIDENEYNEPIYYLDEWFQAIGVGKINPSSTDEVRTHEKNMSAHLQQLFSKAQGKLQSSENLLRAKSNQRAQAEESIKKRIDSVFVHDSVIGLAGIQAPFTDLQRRELSSIAEAVRSLNTIDRELNTFLNEYRKNEQDLQSLQQKVDAAGGGERNVSGINTELETIRQMAKMTCGRQGNHFPILSREFFRCTPNEIGIRENVLKLMSWVESIDCQAYCRQYRSQLNRIPPFVILIPSYGDIGFCWEPFDRYNRVTSRGRIVIPMYTKNLRRALLTATADLRWQVAKEKASYYWMEEGLTGNYYQWFQAQKLKGDVKDYFINDYLLWMMKESEGIQKLDKEVRNVFWRYMPFSQTVKDDLRKRAPVYQDLYQKDINRQMSDGY